ncbi:class II aldolase and adducin N-terminal domain-containing protein [Dongia sp.]|uniref:class II aldolase and adducin N-terminal domain-containing protein n=1 Tax=Dongia sp. TaxID=1977262 RepID=UPI0035ADEE1F
MMTSSIARIPAKGRLDNSHYEARCDLAAAFRWTAELNMHEGVANHFSLAVSDDGSQFLVNPCGKHFSRIKASDLLLLDANDPTTMDQPNAPDPTAWYIHGAIHRNVPSARCVLHVHSKYALVLATLKDPSMPPIDQNTMRFYNRIAFDLGFDGMGLGDEGERLSHSLTESKKVMVMGNHGVLTTGNSVAEAFDTLYYFERAAETLITAYMTGRELSIASDDVAEKTAKQWEEYPSDMMDAHFKEIRAILDQKQPDYAE